MAARVAAVIGGTGLVGKCLVNHLVEDPAFSSVINFVRRQPNGTAPEKLVNTVIDFDSLDSAISNLTVKPTDAFCCLGTTIKTAGSKEAFAKVDLTYVVNFAKAVHAAGI